MGEPLAKKVLLIGFDGADWKLINPLMDQGLMPALERLVNEGVMGNVATLQPILSPLLWNSIATGKRADKHGILNFVEPDPHSGGLRPITSTSRKVKAVWNILTQRGFRTHVLGWFAGHPAEPINGVCISPLYTQVTAPPDQPRPLPPGTIHPAELAETLAELRISPAEITGEELLPFVPLAAQVDQEKDRRLAVVAKLLAENCSVHNAATWILQNQQWDFLAVFYDGIDHFSHSFMQFHPPRMEGVPEDLFELYKDVVTGAYRFHDMLLETLMALAGPEATVILVSDHGFHSDHLRPRGMPREPAGPAVWHRPHGILCLKGPHLQRDERIYGATLLDMTPTILTLFGLPVGQDMDGKVLVQAFEEPPQIERIPSWEQEAGECGTHPAEMRMDPEAARAVIEQFVALGYIEPPSEDQSRAVALANRETKYNLARVYLDSRRPAEALPLLKELAEERPEEARFAQHLAECHKQLGQIGEAKAVLAQLLERGQTEPPSDLLMGVIKFEEGDTEGALEHLLRAEEANPRLPGLHLRIGNAYLRMRRWEDAERAFEKALAIDGDSAYAHLGMAVVRLRQRRSREAAEQALVAVGLQHFLPLGHYCLGVALARLRRLDRAVLAFEMALTMAPGMLNAHRWIATIEGMPGGNAEKAAYHRRQAQELAKQRRRAARR